MKGSLSFREVVSGVISDCVEAVCLAAKAPRRNVVVLEKPKPK